MQWGAEGLDAPMRSQRHQLGWRNWCLGGAPASTAAGRPPLPEECKADGLRLQRALVELRAHCPGTQGHPLLPVDEYLPILARAHPDGNAPWLRTWSAKDHHMDLLTLVPAIAKYGQNESTTHAHMVAPWLGCVASSPRLMGYWRTAGKSLRYSAFVICLVACVLLLVGTTVWARRSTHTKVLAHR